jgi:hypothetical protein
MKTREEIRIELEAANPTTNISGVVYYPGDAQYEELMEQWIDAMLDMPPPAPIVVSMRSFREACGRDLVIKINAFVASIPDAYERFSVQNDLEYALTVARDHPKVAQVAAAIGKTESEIDEVFALAQQLDAA